MRGETVVAARRAGFWRRAIAQLIDTLLVVCVSQAAVMLLFPLTGGRIQMDIGFLWVDCRPTLENIPGAPTPPGTLALHCRSSLDVPTANALHVVRLIPSNDGAPSRTYRLNAHNEVVQGFAVDPVVALALLIYLVERASRAGRTLGDRWLGCRIVDARSGGRPAWGRVLLRYIFMSMGAVPALVWGALANPLSVLALPFGVETLVKAGAVALFALAWTLTNIVLVALKRDPLYDRWAGTAVLRA